MKQSTSFFNILIIAVVIIFNACTKQSPVNTQVSLLVDLTGSYKDNANIDSEKILRLFSLESIDNYGSFRTDYISDVNYSNVQQASVPPINSMIEYNEFEREGKLMHFKKQVTSMIEKTNTTKRGKPSSAVYIPIAREINRIARTNANRKVVVIYSDLFENSPFFRFFENQNLKLLLNNPVQVQQLFQKQQPLNEDLTGVHIYIVYQAPNQETSQIFQLFSNRVYKPMLEDRGAEVTIGANLIL